MAVPTHELKSTLTQAPRQDIEMRSDAADTLFWEQRMGGFLQQPCVIEPPCCPLNPGQVLAGRFEIGRRLGEGGMGVVFEAFDRKRRARIALKCAKPGFQRLLTPELERSLSIRHAYICRVNEIHTAHTDAGEVDFLTMELLEGQTLTQLIGAHGRLPKRQVQSIAEQLCSALSAAHRMGVVHGDFKSANIFITQDDRGKLRAVVMDFGLSSTADIPGVRGGTPGYIAPEILEGGTPSISSDIYALGAVLYEMATGHRPCGPSAGSTVPFPPGKFPAKVPAHWKRAILACLAPLPGKRTSDAAKVYAELRTNRRRIVGISGPIIACICASLLPNVRDYVHDVIWPTRYLRLAVLPESQADASKLPPGLLADIADRLTHVRDGRRMIVTLSSEYVDRVLGPLPRREGASMLGATHELRAGLMNDGEHRYLRFSVVDIGTTKVLEEFQLDLMQSSNVPHDVVRRIARHVGAHDLPASEDLLPVAVPSYDLALSFLWGSDLDKAIELLNEAARKDPASVLPLTMLVDAYVSRYTSTGDRGALEDASSSLKKARALDISSARVQVASGYLDWARGDYPRSLESYSRAEKAEPGNLGALFGFVDVYGELESSADFVDAYQRILDLYPGCAPPRQGLGSYYMRRGRYAQAADMFQRAIQLAPANANAMLAHAIALFHLGRYEEAEAAVQASRRVRDTPEALIGLARIRLRQDRVGEASSYLEQATTMRPANLPAWTALGDAYRRLGRKEATRTYEHALELGAARLRKDPKNPRLRAAVAYLYSRLGDKGRANDEIAQALQHGTQESDVLSFAVSTYVVLGRQEAAVKLLSQMHGEIAEDLLREPDLTSLIEATEYRAVAAR